MGPEQAENVIFMSSRQIYSGEELPFAVPQLVVDNEANGLAFEHGLQLAARDGAITDSFAEFVENMLSDRLTEPDNPEVEEYGVSMRVVRAAGRAALNAEGEVLEMPEVRRLRDEFETSIDEMEKTAKGIGEFITIERDDTFDVIGGKIRTATGEPIRDLIERGAVRSREIGEHVDPRMITQADRDDADLRLLDEYIEPMFSGAGHNTVIAFSAFPEDVIERFGSDFIKELGYNVDFECAMGQLSHAENGRLRTKVMSIDESNVGLLASKLRGRGVQVPNTIKPHELINHPFIGNMGYDEACEFLREFIVEYESERGLPPKVTTTRKLAQEQKGLRDRAFQTMYLPVAISLEEKAKTPVLKAFIDSVKPVAGYMDAASRAQFERVTNQPEFDDDAARTMHGAVLFAVAAHIRKAIVEKIELRSGTADLDKRDFRVYFDSPTSDIAFIHQMAYSFNNGVRQGLNFGGCGTLFDFNRGRNPQDMFGGVNQGNQDDDTDSLGDRNFTCSKGHPNYRAIRNRKVLRCRTCKEDVSCEVKV